MVRTWLVAGTIFACCGDHLLAQAVSGPSTASSNISSESGLPMRPARHISFTTDQGTWMSLALSPDGSTIIFDHLGDLFSLPVSGGTARRLTSGMAFDSQPSFSPDGKTITFISDRNGSENLWIMAADGTNPRPLSLGNGARYASPVFMPDGQRVLVSRRAPTNYHSTYELWVYDLRGGAGVRLTQSAERPDLPADQWSNALGGVASPDGRTIYYSRSFGETRGSAQNPRLWQVVSQDLGTGDVNELTGGPRGGMRPVVSPDGKTLAFADRVDRTTRLRLMDPKTGEQSWAVEIDRDDQETLSLPDRDLVPGYAFAPDGKSIFAAFGGRIHRIDTASGTTVTIPMRIDVEIDLGPSLHNDRKIESGPVIAHIAQGAVYAPDNRRIAASMFGQLYVFEDGHARRLSGESGHAYQPAWSPDGKRIAFVDWDDRVGGSLWSVASSGGKPVRLTTEPGYYSYPAWSPDGKRIVALRSPWQRAREVTDIVAIPGTRLTWIAASGGDVHDIVAAGSASRPHFSGDPDRIYLSSPAGQWSPSPTGGIESVRWDGSDRRRDYNFKPRGNWGRDAYGGQPAKLSPDGRYVATILGSHLYVMAALGHGKSTLTQDLANPALPVVRLSTIGADDFAWNADGSAISWTVGATMYRRQARDFAFSPATAAGATARPREDGLTEATRLAVTMPRETPEGTIVLTNARLITMRGQEVIPSGTIVIAGNRIAAIGPSATISPPSGARIIDLAGKVIVPGFVDLHAHNSAIRNTILATPSYPLAAYLAYGVTTIRDPQTQTLDLFVYQDLIDAGLTVGPRAFSTGPGITWATDFASLEDAVDVATRYAEAYRVSTVKSYLIDQRRQRQWMIEASARLNLRPTTEGASKLALDLTHVIDGFDLEHNLPITPLYDDVVQLVARSGTVYDPAFLMTYGGPSGDDYYWTRDSLHDDPKLRRFLPHTYLDTRSHGRLWISDADNMIPSFAADAVRMIRAGGHVVVGSHGDFYGYGYHENLRALASGGATPYEVLRAATIEGANAIGYGAELGSLEPGKLADLIVLDRDPLEDIGNSNSIRYVMKNGVLYDGQTLDELWPLSKTFSGFWWSNVPYPAAQHARPRVTLPADRSIASGVRG